MATLTIYRGDAVVKRHDLTDRDVRIGRGSDNDLVLEDAGKAVSRFHAELRFENGGYVLLDLNSQNGVWIDGRRVQREALKNGSSVTVGPYRLVFESEAPAAAGQDATAVPERREPSTAVLPKGGATAAPAKASDTLPGRQMTPPAAQPAARANRRPAAPKGAHSHAAPAPAPGLIGWLLRLPRAVLFGGFAAICLLIILAGQIVNSEPTVETSPKSVADGPAPVAPQPTSAELIATHLTAGKELMNQGRAAEARERFQQALLIDKEHAEALDLRARADEAMRQPQPATAKVEPQTPAPSPRVDKPALAVGGPTDTAVPAAPRRQPAQSTERDRKLKELQGKFASAQASVDRGEFGLAQNLLDEIVQEDPNFPDVAALRARAQDGERDARARLAQKEFDEGRKFEASNDFLNAMAAYRRAERLAPTLNGLDAAIAQLRGKSRSAGEDAFKRAKTYDAVGRVPEALALYERAVQLLPEDHPSRGQAQDRITTLKAIVR